jgi:hypothetical protein
MVYVLLSGTVSSLFTCSAFNLLAMALMVGGENLGRWDGRK